jgi:hypothetical protein
MRQLLASYLVGNAQVKQACAAWSGCCIIAHMAAKPKVLYLRNVPDDLLHKLKAAAALSGGQSIQKYVVQLLIDHVADLERKGQLPKGKR